MNFLLASALLAAKMTRAAASYDLAYGAHISASSTYTSGPCSIFTCGPHQAISNIPNSTIDVGQWISRPNTCDSDWSNSGIGSINPAGRHNESLFIDWSTNFGNMPLSEVRFRYGNMAPNPWGVSIIIFSPMPLGMTPIAVPYQDGSNWYAFTFETPVLATGVQLVWYGLQSRDNGKTCYISVADVEAWMGDPPNPLPPASSGDNRNPSPISFGSFIAMIILPVLGVLACAGFTYWFLVSRRKNLLARSILARDMHIRRQLQKREKRGQKLVDETEEEGEEAQASAEEDATNVWNVASASA